MSFEKKIFSLPYLLQFPYNFPYFLSIIIFPRNEQKINLLNLSFIQIFVNNCYDIFRKKPKRKKKKKKNSKLTCSSFLIFASPSRTGFPIRHNPHHSEKESFPKQTYFPLPDHPSIIFSRSPPPFSTIHRSTSQIRFALVNNTRKRHHRRSIFLQAFEMNQ